MSPGHSLEAWIATRTPPVPDAFRRWMVPSNPDSAASVGALLDEALESLESVRHGRGRPRDGAFDLLAADGFATWACEAALDDVDAVESLARIVDALLE